MVPISRTGSKQRIQSASASLPEGVRPLGADLTHSSRFDLKLRRGVPTAVMTYTQVVVPRADIEVEPLRRRLE